jgi:hypothetical protein
MVWHGASLLQLSQRAHNVFFLLLRRAGRAAQRPHAATALEDPDLVLPPPSWSSPLDSLAFIWAFILPATLLPGIWLQPCGSALSSCWTRSASCGEGEAIVTHTRKMSAAIFGWPIPAVAYHRRLHPQRISADPHIHPGGKRSQRLQKCGSWSQCFPGRYVSNCRLQNRS